MSRYDSLAEQMTSDYKSIMLAFSTVSKKMDSMAEDIRRAEKSMHGLHTTVMTILDLTREADTRFDALERRVEILEKRTPPAA